MPIRVPHSGPDPPRFECAGSAPAVPSTSGTAALPAASASALPWCCIPLPPELHAVVEPLLRSHGIAPQLVAAQGAMLLVVPASAATSPEDLAHALARACDTRTIVDEIRTVVLGAAQQTRDLRGENTQLQKENEELRTLQKEGFFKFALRVDGEDFRAFALIMALGNRKAAADFLEVPHRSFYDRVEKWASRGKDYQRLYRFVEWRKKVGRKIMVPLGDSVQSGEPSDNAENPATVAEVADKIATAGNQDYPSILREILEALAEQNPENWAEVRGELMEMIREEVGG